MPFTYTGASWTYIPDNVVAATVVLYPTSGAGGTSTTPGDSTLANATRVNIMGVVVTKVGSGTITISGSAAVLGITPTVTGPIDLGPIGLEMVGGFRVSCSALSTHNIIVLWKRIQ